MAMEPKKKMPEGRKEHEKAGRAGEKVAMERKAEKEVGGKGVHHHHHHHHGAEKKPAAKK